MQAVSQSQPARNMAAKMAANLPGGGGGGSDGVYALNSFAPTARQVTQGGDVQFITNVTNSHGDSREAQFFVMLDGIVVATESKFIDANETRDVAQTKSYSDLKTAVGNDGDYSLSVKVHWVDGDVQDTQTWGTMTLGSSDSGGDDNNNDDPDNSTQEIPKQYLLAGGGAFGLLFLLVLLA